jgi:predicted enzyme related to lactoylglutathione lyase
MTASIGEFIWYELMTTDADAACRYYGDLVGWQVEDSGLADMDYRILNAGDAPIGGVMQLSEEMMRGGAQPGWFAYIEVDDVDATVESVKADGGGVMVPPNDIPNVGRFAMITDPQGISIYVMHSTSADVSQAFKADAPGHCAWNELPTPDVQAALRFYPRHFGWTLGQTMPMGDMGDYQMFEVDGQTVGGIMKATTDGPRPMWRFYFRVPSLAAAMRKIENGNGTLTHGPQEVPADDEILIGTDPQGAVFALVAKREKS